METIINICNHDIEIYIEGLNENYNITEESLEQIQNFICEGYVKGQFEVEHGYYLNWSIVKNETI